MELNGELRGAEEMKQALSRVETNVARKHLRTALRAGAKVIAAELVATAESPDLASAVKVRAGKRSRTGMSVMVTVSRPMENSAGGGGTWIGFYNFGHRIGRRIKAAALSVLRRAGLKRKDVSGGGRVQGSHWLDRGFERSEAAAVDVIQETLLQGLEEEISKSGAQKR